MADFPQIGGNRSSFKAGGGVAVADGDFGNRPTEEEMPAVQVGAQARVVVSDGFDSGPPVAARAKVVTPNPPTLPTLKLGSKGPDVKQLQTQLNRTGALNAAMRSGVNAERSKSTFGPATQRGVAAFQSKTPGLKVSGEADTATRLKLASQPKPAGWAALWSIL